MDRVWGSGFLIEQVGPISPNLKFKVVLVPLDGEGNGTPLEYSCQENSMEEEPGRLWSMGSLRVRHD